MSWPKIQIFMALACLATLGFSQNSTEFTSLAIPGASVTNKFPGSTERHLQPTPTGVLYSNSGFAHGFRHGYERGFHIGDLDFQMGRGPRFVFNSKEYQQFGRDYSPDFGSRPLFDEGYKAGFHRGYGDAISGLEFRLFDQIRSAAVGLTEILAPTRRSHFDEGFADGFKSSQMKSAPVVLMSTDYVEQYCLKSASGAYALEYCSGFSRGYILGSSGAHDTKITVSQSKSH